MQAMRKRGFVFLIVSFVAISSLSIVKAEGDSVSQFSIEQLFPLLSAILIASMVWRWFIPNQLANLQVAFEIDDDLYEVHRITRDVSDARELLSEGSVGYGVGLYMMGMTGILVLIAEFIFDPNSFFTPDLYIIGLLVLVPILISPWETLNAQLTSKKQNSMAGSAIVKFLRRTFTLILLIGSTIAVLYYGMRQSDDLLIEPVWLAAAMLVFMSPTIFAYGRIMGASWNMLLINKWRTSNGRKNPIDPDKAGILNRLFSLILVIFLLTMPLTALNGIVTVIHVLINEPTNSTEVLNYGGIIGHSLYERIDIISEILFEWEIIKSMPQFLSLYLSMNIAIVGLAFIFELTRNLVLGGQTFGGVFGVTLDTPRDIRSEVSAQTRQLKFAFAGFSGYTVLLLVLVCYKEFGALMPFTDWIESKGFDEGMRLLTTWMFIAVGQTVFLLTWLVSIIRYSSLRKLRFDLNPDERREGAVKLAGGDWMRTLVDEAALEENLDTLIQFQRRSLDGDPSLVRHEKARARMWELAIRGLWPLAIEESRKVLAQSGGDDDIARMLIAVGHMASRRLDAAREALHGLEQPEGYDEPELLSFVCEWLDPWQGNVNEDDFWDWENNSCIDHIQNTMQMIRNWNPKQNMDVIHKDRLTRVAQLSMVSLLRAQRMHDDALDLALKPVRAEPTGVRPRIASALCLIDKGDWHSARSIEKELLESDPHDPRVLALSTILGQTMDEDEFEVALVTGEGKKMKKWINSAPVNSVAALGVKGGMDEAINANVLITAHEATRRSMPPRYSSGRLILIANILILIPLWILIGIYVASIRAEIQGFAVTSTLLLLHYSSRKLLMQQRRQIRHRDQKAMVAYAKRMKRFKVSPDRSNLPVGTHLLLSGILVSVNGVVLDIGVPAWLTEHLPKDSDKTIRARLKRRSKKISKSRPPRLQPLGEGWWLKRPKEEGSDTPALERLIGPVAYRGRPSYIDRKSGKNMRPTGMVRTSPRPAHSVDLGSRGIPTNTRKSERRSKLPQNRPNVRVGNSKNLPSNSGKKRRPPK
ncbi:MAG: hypothetical protein HON16_05585 [Euryarchaeota archaeon]|nr:hypothetical protein [Euryarchaeota archaeon]